MNVKFTGLGAEPKKLIGLGVCLVIAAYFYFSSGSGGPGGSGSSAPGGTAPSSADPVRTSPVPHVPKGRGLQRGQGSNTLEFRPSLKPPKDLDLNRANIDPTLKLALLEKLQSVKAEAGGRSLFESASTPPAVLAANFKEPPHINVFRPYGPTQPKPVEVAKVVEPPPPPIPLKFYGFVSPKATGPGAKRAFFLDGEDIIVASEGQMVKNRYKIVRIGVNSAVVEDTQSKNNQQTLPLVEEQAG